MIVLALDTTGPHCSVALADGPRILASISEKIGRGHAESLAPMVQDVFAEAKLSADAVKRLAVCTGPGSFTGLRVALSYAKGFALPRNIPVVGVDALALTYLEQGMQPSPATIWADVRRDQVMFGDYAGAAPLNGKPPQLASLAQRDQHVAKAGLPVFECEAVNIDLLAKVAARFADEDLSLYPAIPLYARAPDAKLPGGVDPQ